MGVVRDQLELVAFCCDACGHRWEAAPDRVEDCPGDAWHPWMYYAACPDCGGEGEQSKGERGRLKAWSAATGPRTADGKAKSAANLEGHPTPDESKATRFNALKHGIYAEVATYFPARPGQYPHCEGCHYRDYECHYQAACLKRTELFLKHHAAFEANDPSMLTGLRANLQAAVAAIIDDIVITIIRDGVELRSPCWYYDKDGGFHLAQYTNDAGEKTMIEEVKAHPLLKPLIDLMSKNGLTLGDQGMTPKVREDADQLKGSLDEQGADRDKLLEYQRVQAESLEKLGDMIGRSMESTRLDPMVIDHDG